MPLASVAVLSVPNRSKSLGEVQAGGPASDYWLSFQVEAATSRSFSPPTGIAHREAWELECETASLKFTSDVERVRRIPHPLEVLR